MHFSLQNLEHFTLDIGGKDSCVLSYVHKMSIFPPHSILTAWHSAFVKESHLASCWRLHHYYSNQCTVDPPDNDSTAWTNASDLHLQKNQNIWKWHTFLKNASLNVLVLSFAVPAEVLCRSTWSWSDTGLQHWGGGGQQQRLCCGEAAQSLG